MPPARRIEPLKRVPRSLPEKSAIDRRTQALTAIIFPPTANRLQKCALTHKLCARALPIAHIFS